MYTRGWQTFSGKDQILGLVGHVASVAVARLYHCSGKQPETRLTVQTWLCSSKTLFTKTGEGLDWAFSHSLWTPDLSQRDFVCFLFNLSSEGSRLQLLQPRKSERRKVLSLDSWWISCWGSLLGRWPLFLPRWGRPFAATEGRQGLVLHEEHTQEVSSCPHLYLACP